MIIRRRHTANFTTIGNMLFEDERLAADEVGILAYLLSRPHDWEVRRPALSRRWGMGREAIKRVITNFLRTGWAQAQRVRLANGTTHVIYEIRDEPGSSLSEDEVRRALSLVSSEAATAENEESSTDFAPPGTDEPHTGHPSLADPPPADPYVAHKKELNTELPRKDSNQIERDTAIGHDRKARFIAAFEMRWPTAATDDRTRTAKAARDLADAEEEAALNGVGPFLEKLKRDGRKHVPAGWKYLEEKRWTLLEAEKPAATPLMQKFEHGGREAKAIAALYTIAGKASVLGAAFMRASDGGIYYRREMTPRLLALADAPPADQWIALDNQQAGAWNALLTEFVALDVWTRLTAGARAPWPWPPRKDGTLSTAGPSDALMTTEDWNTDMAIKV